MNKTVSIEDTKNTVEIAVAGEVFAISRVVLAVHDMYNEYIEALTDYQAHAEEYGVVERMRRFLEIRKNHIVPIMALLLEKNGYTYDDDWWKRNVESYDTMDQFIREAMSKDVPDVKKKVAAEDRPTDTD